MGIAWHYSFKKLLPAAHGDQLGSMNPQASHELKYPLLGFDILRFFMKLSESDSPAERHPESHRNTGMHISKNERHAC